MIALPVSLPDPSLPCYATELEAAHDALHAAIALGRDAAEAGGAIYAHGPLYCYTVPVTQGMPDSVDYRVGLTAPDHVVGLYHTHPGWGATYRLSSDDVALSRQLHLTMYIGSVERRILTSYCPDTGRLRREAL